MPKQQSSFQAWKASTSQPGATPRVGHIYHSKPCKGVTIARLKSLNHYDNPTTKMFPYLPRMSAFICVHPIHLWLYCSFHTLSLLPSFPSVQNPSTLFVTVEQPGVFRPETLFVKSHSTWRLKLLHVICLYLCSSYSSVAIYLFPISSLRYLRFLLFKLFHEIVTLWQPSPFRPENFTVYSHSTWRL